MPAVHLHAGLVQGRGAQRPLEGHPAGPHAHWNLAPVRQPHPDRLGASRKPPVQRPGQLLLQRLHDLIPERVSVVELHDPPPRPGTIRRWPGIALDRDHLVAPACQARTEEQAGRASANDGYAHDNPHLRYTNDAMTALIVQRSLPNRQDPEPAVMSQPARRYTSEIRDEQARRTRRAIVAASHDLFLARGYAATTVDAIAQAAHVSRRTVFNSAGGKAALLKLAWDWAIVGDDEPIPLADRPAVKAIQAEPDPHKALALWAQMVVEIAARAAPIAEVLTAAADADADAAQLAADADRDR